MKIELSTFQESCLKKFVGVRALTETGLARAVSCEKAMAKHAIRVLLAQGVIRQLGAYEYVLTHEGAVHLNAKGTPAKEQPAPKADTMAKLEALDLPPSNQTLAALAEMTGEDVVPDFYKAITEGHDQVAFNVRKSGTLKIEDGHAKFTPDPVTIVESTPEGSDKQRIEFSEGTGPGIKPEGRIVFPDPNGDWGNVLNVSDLPAHDMGANRFAEIPAPDRADFATLVRQGLARLNAQLGQQPIAIENAALKVETLEGLAESIGNGEPEIYVILRAIAQDIQRIADRSSK